MNELALKSVWTQRFSTRSTIQALHRTTVLLTGVTISALLFFSGCSSSSEEPEEAAKEVPLAEAPPMDGTEEDLFVTAKKLYSNGYYLVAKDAFRSVAASYPLGPYGEFAEIKLADSMFLQREFEEASQLYEQILKNYPSSPSAPYVTLKAGRSYHQINEGVGRDREPLEKAIKHYQSFLQSYPDSMFRTQVETYYHDARETLVENEKMVADFYKKRGHMQAYEKRQRAYQVALVNYGLASEDTISQTTPPVLLASNRLEFSTPEVVKLGRASMNPELLEQVETEDDIEVNDLAYETPASTLTPQVVSAQSISRAKKSSLVTAASGSSARRNETAFGRSVVRDIECSSRAGRKISIELREEPSEEIALQELAPTDGTLQKILPIELADPLELNCFDEGDLSISKDGALSLQTKKSFTLFQLDNPTRLMLVEADS